MFLIIYGILYFGRLERNATSSHWPSLSLLSATTSFVSEMIWFYGFHYYFLFYLRFELINSRFRHRFGSNVQVIQCYYYNNTRSMFVQLRRCEEQQHHQQLLPCVFGRGPSKQLHMFTIEPCVLTFLIYKNNWLFHISW